MKEILVCSLFRIHCYVAAPFTLLVGSLDLIQFSLLFCDQRDIYVRGKNHCCNCKALFCGRECKKAKMLLLYENL
jgi:hypothetical protein